MIQDGRILAPECPRLRKYADGILLGLSGGLAYKAAFHCKSLKEGNAGHRIAQTRNDVRIYLDMCRDVYRDFVGISEVVERAFLHGLIRKGCQVIERNDPQGRFREFMEFCRYRLSTDPEECADMSMRNLKSIVYSVGIICPVPLDRYIQEPDPDA
jgi:hypothetical protein